MAVAVVRGPDGKELATYERRSEERAWLTVQGQASYPVSVDEGAAIETRWRFPVGAIVAIDGVDRYRRASTGWVEVGSVQRAPELERAP